MVTATFDKWFDGLTTEQQEALIAHIFKKQIGTPIMEGLFSGPSGTINKGIFSGPTGRTNTGACSACGRAL